MGMFLIDAEAENATRLASPTPWYGQEENFTDKAFGIIVVAMALFAILMHHATRRRCASDHLHSS